MQIVDEFTGRVVENRWWSEGIHQAVEGLHIQADAVTVAEFAYLQKFRILSFGSADHA